jgi:hypothetical protein
MARINANETPLPMGAGSYRALALTGIDKVNSQNGAGGYAFTFLDCDPESTTHGSTYEETVYGWVSKGGKAPWLERIIGPLAKGAAMTLKPIDGDTQPADSLDWEEPEEVKAACLGAVFAVTIETEPDEEKPDGTRWPSKLKIGFNRNAPTPVTGQLLKDARESRAWMKVRADIAKQRAAAIEVWRRNLTATAAPAGDSGAFADDDIPF